MTDRIVPARGGAAVRAGAPFLAFRMRGAARFSAALFAAVLAASTCLAADAAVRKSTADEQKSDQLSPIYNNDLALVKDVRDIELPNGVLDLKFEGVAARIDPTSVHIRSLTDPGKLSRARAELRVRSRSARRN